MQASKKKQFLKHNIRKQIYYNILKYPGIHYNELLRKTHLASGQLTHHLHILEKNDLIYKEKNKVSNYYSLEDDFGQNNKYLKYLRDSKKREIIKMILKDRIVPFSHFKEEIQLSPSTISWHLKELVEDNIILSKTSKKKKYYFLTKEIEEIFNELFRKEKKSVLSNLVDSFIEFWDNDF